MGDPAPFELEPADVPRRPPATVTIGDGSGQRKGRRGGLAALGLAAALATLTVATRGPPSDEAAPPTSTAGSSFGPPIVSVYSPPGLVTTDSADARFHPLRFDGPSTALGPADWVMASAEPGRVWLLRDAEGRTIATEVMLDGAATGSWLDIPSSTHPVAAVDGGLLVQGFGRFYIRTTDDLRPVAAGALVAAGGGWLATQSCDDALLCGVHLVDLGTGADRALDVGEGWDVRFPDGSFSPDGRTLALWLYGETGARLVFVDTATAAVADLPEPAPPFDSRR